VNTKFEAPYWGNDV